MPEAGKPVPGVINTGDPGPARFVILVSRRPGKPACTQKNSIPKALVPGIANNFLFLFCRPVKFMFALAITGHSGGIFLIRSTFNRIFPG